MLETYVVQYIVYGIVYFNIEFRFFLENISCNILFDKLYNKGWGIRCVGCVVVC